jgi:hypothetical protein
MSSFGTNPVQGQAGLGAAHHAAAKDAQRKESAKADTPRLVNRMDDSVEFEDAAKHATSEDGGRRRQHGHDQHRDQQEQQRREAEGGLDVQG